MWISVSNLGKEFFLPFQALVTRYYLCTNFYVLIQYEFNIDFYDHGGWIFVTEKEAEKKQKEKAADIAKQKALEAIEKKRKEGEWYEAKSAEGYTYYWNTVSHGNNGHCTT